MLVGIGSSGQQPPRSPDLLETTMARLEGSTTAALTASASNRRRLDAIEADLAKIGNRR